MRGRYPLLLVVLAFIFGTACTFSTLIPAQTAPTAAPTAEPTRPQTAFIDGRTVVDASLVVNSGSTSAQPMATQQVVVVQPYSAQASGGSYTASGGGGYGGGYWGSCTPNYSWGYTYVIQRGDTLYSIALRAGTTVQVLAQANCIYDPNRIFAGQVLRVPQPVYYQPPPPYNPPPYNPPPSPGYQYIGQVLPSPFVSVNGGQYQLQGGAVINLVWGINSNGLTRVDFIFSPSGTGMSPVILGTDTYFGDGISINWAVPPGIIGSLSANGYWGSGLVKQTASYTFVYANAAPPPPTPAPQPPVVVGSGLTFSPYDSINNNTVNLPPDTLITISWNGTFPAATDRVEFQLIPPGESSGSAIAFDTNLGDGATVTWYAVRATQGTIRAVAYFQGGYPPQYSDSYYVIAGYP